VYSIKDNLKFWLKMIGFLPIITERSEKKTLDIEKNPDTIKHNHDTNHDTTQQNYDK